MQQGSDSTVRADTAEADAHTDAQVDVAVASNVLAIAGQSDLIWGHVSLRDPDGRGAWLKASGWGFEEITPERVVLVDRDGATLAGSGRRHIEYPIHLEVMAARGDVGSVVHTHSRAASAFASLDVPLRAISHDGVEFAEPPVPRFLWTGALIRSRDLGEALAETIGDGPGCLVPQHGLVTVGPDLASAVMRAILLDRACAQMLTALAAGGPALWSGSAELALKRAEVWPPDQLRAGYAYLVRGLSTH